MDKHCRIAIVGAGAAGLSAAYFLQEKGYTNVTVFEKTDRVGGKCRSFTYHGKTYEEGAITVTKAYRELRKIISKLGLHLTDMPPRKIMEPGKKKRSLHEAFASTSSKFKVFAAVLRYFWAICRYRNLGKPGFANLDRELSLPFTEWAKKNNIEAIVPMFILPICLFGFGDLDVIPAAYVLKYIRFLNFLAMILIFLFGRVGTYRIIEGYGRIWEHLARNINVRLNSVIERIDRSEKINIYLQHGETIQFDALIIACPFKEVLHFLDVTKEERDLLLKVKTYNYFITVFQAAGLSQDSLYAIPLPKKGHAYVIHRPWQENELYVAYSFADKEVPEKEIIRLLEEDVQTLGSKVIAIVEQIHWNYFPHVTSEEIADGFYGKVEAMQGKHHTFFTGGTLAFESVETVIRYSKELIEREFGFKRPLEKVERAARR